MEKSKIALLQAEIQAQMETIEKIYSKIAARKTSYANDEEGIDSMAFQLHNLYCALEDVFRIVADRFENHLTDPIGWHSELLTRMKLHIGGVRPALISEPTYELLDELRGFRHVVRHAYGKELDPAKIELVLQKALALKKVYAKEFRRFLSQLKALKSSRHYK
jgi:hypothetical protein